MSEVLDRDEFEDFYKNLKDWKNKDRTTVCNIVKRLLKAKITKQYQSRLQDIVGHVFKEMMNAQNVDKAQVSDMNQLKKKLKENQKHLIQEQKNQKIKSEAQKKEIIPPEELGRKLEARRQDYIKYLFKSMIRNLSEQQIAHKNMVSFLQSLEKELYDQFEGDDAKILKQLKEIRFSMEPNSSVAAKVRMLAGEISPKDVVLNKSSTYAVVQSRKSSGESHEVMKAALTGEGETCEKCHRPEAVCTKMLQIRAADEPMTRFMHCRACNHQWTDN